EQTPDLVSDDSRPTPDKSRVARDSSRIGPDTRRPGTSRRSLKQCPAILKTCRGLEDDCSNPLLNRKSKIQVRISLNPSCVFAWSTLNPPLLSSQPLTLSIIHAFRVHRRS